MTDNDAAKALEEFDNITYEADGINDRVINLFSCDTVIAIRSALTKSAKADDKVINAIQYFELQPFDSADGHDCQLRVLLNFARERVL